MKQAQKQAPKKASSPELATLNNKVGQSKKAVEKAMADYQKKVAEYEALWEKEADKIQLLKAAAAMRIGKLTYKIKKTSYKLAKSELKLAQKAQNKLAPAVGQTTPSAGKPDSKAVKGEAKAAKKAQSKAAPAADQTKPSAGKPAPKTKKKEAGI